MERASVSFGPLLLFLLLLLFGAASPKHHRGNPADDIFEMINVNRTSKNLPKLNDNPGLACMALQYIMECGGNCSKNNTSNCTPAEVDITEVFAPNCGVELPTVNNISGRLVGCNWDYLEPVEAYSTALVPDNKTLSVLQSLQHTQVGIGLGGADGKSPFFWCVLFSSGPPNSTFVLDIKEMTTQKHGCFSGMGIQCNSSLGLSFSSLLFLAVLICLLSLV